MKNEKVILVKMHNRLLGRLALGRDRLCRFEYSDAWLADGFSISPFVLPLRKELFVARHEPFDGLFGVFADSMPDGWGNLLLDRFLMSQGIRLSELTILDRLALVGSSGLGALQYEPDKSVHKEAKAKKLDKIAEQVAEILAEKASIPTVNALLEQTGSSGGARPKVVVKYKDADWLVKFPSGNDPQDIGQQEFFYSNLAGQCGIIMSETKLFDGKYFGTKLFDRNERRRIHMHSAAGLLYASFRYPSLDYLELAKLSLALNQNMAALEQLFRLMIFNVLIKNKDDHAKNFSFLYQAGEWKLSPAYDVLKSNGFGGEHATSVCGAGNPNRKDLLNVAEEVGFPVSKFKRLFEEVYSICSKSEIGKELPF